MASSFILLLVAVIWVWIQIKRLIPSNLFHIGLGIYLALQCMLAYQGFYAGVSRQPIRMALLLGPAILFISWLFFSQTGKGWRSGWSMTPLIMLHLARVPVEFMLLELAMNGLVPIAMSMEGYNFDIFSGLTAPLAYFIYRHYRKEKLFVAFKAWNVICLILLAIVVITGILSAPTPLQLLNFDQPNRAILLVPFNLLPAFIVPSVLISHLHALTLKDCRAKPAG